MTIWQMSLSGGMLIVAVMALRAVMLHRVPKRTFLILWGIVALRLCVPVAFPSPYSIWALVPGWTELLETEIEPEGNHAAPGNAEQIEKGLGTENSQDDLNDIYNMSSPVQTADTNTRLTLPANESGGQINPGDVRSLPPANGNGSQMNRSAAQSLSPWTILWAAGSGLCALFFALVYLREREKFQTALPVDQEWVCGWQKEHSLRRPLAVRQSDRIDTPLTYGIGHPVILLPREMDWEDRETVAYVLEHEFIHVCRFDSLSKLVLVAVLCLHWFNPLVWAMVSLCNRDLELSCDEAVLKKLGMNQRQAYALALIHMEELGSGLLPLANGFSRNAIEERITAIMKIKKISRMALLLATALAVGAFVVFGTAAEPKQVQASAPVEGFSEEEWDMLRALQLDGFMDMTVEAYREQIEQMVDAPEYHSLLERCTQSEALYEKKDEDETAAFVFYILTPLTAEHWQTREFGGTIESIMGDSIAIVPEDAEMEEKASERVDSGLVDRAIFEYFLQLTIVDPSVLTVREYQEARQGTEEDLAAFFSGQSVAMLSNARQVEMERRLKEEVSRITRKWSGDALRVTATYWFLPFSLFSEEEISLRSQSESQTYAEWEKLLAPYAPFGLTWEYEHETDGVLGVRMYWQGLEVRGIYDEAENIWLTEHAGDSTYGEGAVELIAVYEDGRMSGLRAADADEQASWDEIRRQNSQQRSEAEAEAETRMYPHATEAEYRSLFSELMTESYREQSLSVFNARLLDWCNQNSEAMERIGTDAFEKDYQVSLTEDERYFVEVTMALSREENAHWVTSLHTGEPVADSQVDGTHGWLSKQTADGGRWCQLSCRFTYHCEDWDQVTVQERDQAVDRFLKRVADYWEAASLWELLKLKETDVVELFQKYARECSTEGVQIMVDADGVQFEHDPN